MSPNEPRRGRAATSVTARLFLRVPLLSTISAVYTAWATGYGIPFFDHYTDSMLLSSACVCILSPLKADNSSNNAIYLSGHAVGVLYMFGSWKRYSIYAGLYSRALSPAVAAQLRSPCTANAKTALTAHVRRVQGIGIKGYTTALLCVVPCDGELEVRSFGESMPVIVRDFHTIVYASSVQQHAINTPFHVGHTSLQQMGGRPARPGTTCQRRHSSVGRAV